jgi:photosystem II stability/assembly factor-like uncharacterized protein
MKKLIAGLAIVGVALAAPASRAADTAVLHHVHGLAFTADGAAIYVPSHDGLAVYRNDKWSKAPGPEHDYMGFATTKRHFYSSGHPARGSGLTNPFGLMKSPDGGKTWQRLGMEGEADFHLLAAGFETDAVFVFNTARNSRMPAPGYYHTTNDGFSWTRASAEGLRGDPAAVAAHPREPKTVAVATRAGAFVSRDAGERFAPVAEGQSVSVFFDLDGAHLWVGGYAGRATLTRIALASGQAEPVAIPGIVDDAVAYIAQNPVRRGEVAFATFKRDVYLSADGGRTWKAIAQQGIAR